MFEYKLSEKFKKKNPMTWMLKREDKPKMVTYCRTCGKELITNKRKFCDLDCKEGHDQIRNKQARQDV